MFETHNDTVDVLSVSIAGALRPLRFRWQGRTIRIRAVTGQWNRREGQALMRYFAVQGARDESYELCFDARSAQWILRRAWNGEG